MGKISRKLSAIHVAQLEFNSVVEVMFLNRNSGEYLKKRFEDIQEKLTAVENHCRIPFLYCHRHLEFNLTWFEFLIREGIILCDKCCVGKGAIPDPNPGFRNIHGKLQELYVDLNRCQNEIDAFIVMFGVSSLRAHSTDKILTAMEDAEQETDLILQSIDITVADYAVPIEFADLMVMARHGIENFDLEAGKGSEDSRIRLSSYSMDIYQYICIHAKHGWWDESYLDALCEFIYVAIKSSEEESPKMKLVLFLDTLAKCGVPRAQSNLGECYFNGDGVVADMKKAAELYDKAMSQGCTDAQNSLGNCYQHGHGVVADNMKAVALYAQAAANGHTVALFNLGRCYHHGIGVEMDKWKARELYSRAAKQGHAMADTSIASLGE